MAMRCRCACVQGSRHQWRLGNLTLLISYACIQITPHPPIAAGDKRTAQDNHTFLKNWFKRFPHLQKNPFWISGESYAGAGCSSVRGVCMGGCFKHAGRVGNATHINPKHLSLLICLPLSPLIGHYVPTLAAEIIEGNKRADETPFNFKGLLVGESFGGGVLMGSLRVLRTRVSASKTLASMHGRCQQLQA